MDILYFFLLLASVLCFAGAAFGRGRYDNHVSLLPLGLLLFALVPFIGIARVVLD